MDKETKARLSVGLGTDDESGANDSAVKDNLFVGSMEKGIRILYAFGAGHRELRLNQIAEITGLGRSAAQRFTHTLCSLGFLSKDDNGGIYRPAPKLLDLSFIYLRSDPLVEAATPYLIEATKKYRETINLARRESTDMIFIFRVPGRGTSSPSAIAGRRMPVFCTTSGRAVLSLLAEQEARALIEKSDRIPLTPRTITDADEIMNLIRQARQDGFAVAVEEGQLGIITIGAAIQDSLGRPIAAVNMAAETRNWTVEQVRDKLGPVIVQTARTISRTQGYLAAYNDV